MQTPILPVILCGGGGTRLAPLSTPECPKQFLGLFQARPQSLFQRTLLRLPVGRGVLPPLILGAIQHRALIRSQMTSAGIPNATVILEPVGRNTAPAIATAVHWAAEHAPGATLAILPSDHVVGDIAAFRKDILQAQTIADKGYIAIFGIRPVRLETGYGFIEPGEEIASGGHSAFLVDRFVEKPGLSAARQYLEDGSKFWNSGIFIFRPGIMRAEFRGLAPDIGEGAATALQKAKLIDQDLALPRAAYEGLISISLDYAIMEKTKIAAVIEFSSPWRDLGTIDALRAYSSTPAAATDPLSQETLAVL